MYYFVIPFKATINGDLLETGTAGVVSRLKDYHSNAIKTTAIEFYQKKYNTAKPLVVSITDANSILPYAGDLYEILRNELTIEIIEKGSGLTY